MIIKCLVFSTFGKKYIFATVFNLVAKKLKVYIVYAIINLVFLS